MKHFKNIFVIFLSAIVITFIIKLFFLQVYSVHTDSMMKTIEPGNRIIISKFSEIKKNDIVLFSDKDEQLCISRYIGNSLDTVMFTGQNVYLNRQEVNFRKQIMSYCIRFINQFESDSLADIYRLYEKANSGIFEIQLTNEQYKDILNDSVTDLKHNLFPYTCLYPDIFIDTFPENTFIIGRDSVFLLNDNRANMHDSRSFGPIPKGDVIGKLIKVL